VVGEWDNNYNAGKSRYQRIIGGLLPGATVVVSSSLSFISNLAALIGDSTYVVERFGTGADARFQMELQPDVLQGLRVGERARIIMTKAGRLTQLEASWEAGGYSRRECIRSSAVALTASARVTRRA
jgi:hypothetical protein